MFVLSNNRFTYLFTTYLKPFDMLIRMTMKTSEYWTHKPVFTRRWWVLDGSIWTNAAWNATFAMCFKDVAWKLCWTGTASCRSCCCCCCSCGLTDWQCCSTHWSQCKEQHHFILPATQHRWTHPTLTPARLAGTRFTSYSGGMEGWVDIGGWFIWYTC